MKRFITYITFIASLLFVLPGCSSSEWEDVPTPIAQFLSEYFPLQAVSQCSEVDDVYHVKLRNSTSLIFGSNYKWTSINGYGNPLPETLLFDQMPPALYNYLQELSLTDQVYSATRDHFTYNITLLDSSITYTIATGIVTPDIPVSTAIAQLSMQ